LDFAAGRLSSNGGLVLLAELERRSGILERFSSCFRDHRDPRLVEHSCSSLIRQRVLSLALGYEDLVDHDELRSDPLLAAAVGVVDPTGSRRRCAQDRGHPLAGKSTLQRLEASATVVGGQDRYKRIEIDESAIRRFFVDTFLESPDSAQPVLILDLDATDDPLHGQQEGRFFHGYYGHYCYLPLYIFCGHALLWAELRRADIDASAGAQEAVEQIVAQIRERRPEASIVLRADSGFAREALMRWCEQNGVHYLFGLARNRRLERAIGAELHQAQQESSRSDKPARLFKDLRYQTRQSWSCERRVVAKAEFLPKGRNPRFVVTSLSAQDWPGEALYDLYCQRGDMENRIKEQQLDLFADRTSAHWMKINQLRLWFSSVAYVLLSELRRRALADTTLAKAQCGTLRLRLLRVAARVRVTTRRIWISLSSSYPQADLWLRVLKQLQQMPIA
jgi:hypothetical protein